MDDAEYASLTAAEKTFSLEWPSAESLGKTLSPIHP